MDQAFGGGTGTSESFRCDDSTCALSTTHTRDVFYDYNVLDLPTFARFDSASGEGITNGYDAFGRLLSSSSNMDGVSRAVTRSRDDVNNRTSVTYGGQTYVYDHDDASRLEGVYQGNTVTATALLTGASWCRALPGTCLVARHPPGSATHHCRDRGRARPPC